MLLFWACPTTIPPRGEVGGGGERVSSSSFGRRGGGGLEEEVVAESREFGEEVEGFC